MMRQSSPAPRGARQERDRRRSRSRSPHGDGARGGGNRSKLIYITNLSYETRWVELKSILQELGGELSWVDILQDKTGRSKGSALAEFKNIESAESCFHSMSPRYDIGGRSVVCKQIREPQSFLRKIREETGIDYLARSGGDHHRAGPGATGNQRGSEANNGRQENHETYGLSMDFLHTHHIELPLVSRIFIANIPFNVGTGRLCDIFSMAGRIKWIDLQMDKDGRSKGSAVVEYMHPLEAVQSVSMFNQQKLLDRALLVKLDRYTKTDERKPGELPRGMMSIGMGLGADGAPLKDVTSVLASMGKISDFGNQMIQSQMVQQLSQGSFGGVPAPLSLTNPYGPAGGVMNTSQYRSQSFGSTGGDSFGLGTQTAYGGSQGAYGGQSVKAESGTPFGGSSYGAMGSTRTILIKNLPHDYTWQIVSDRVATFGDVEGVEMAGPGVARVRYVTTSDADRAKAALNGTVVEGRGIVVDFVHP